MENLETITNDRFDELTWKCEQEEQNVILFFPEEDDEMFVRYNTYTEKFLDRSFNPNEHQTNRLQTILAYKEEEERDHIEVFDGYEEYGVSRADFL